MRFSMRFRRILILSLLVTFFVLCFSQRPHVYVVEIGQDDLKTDIMPAKPSEPLSEWDKKAAEVVDEFVHCWEGYKASAWGYDDFHPISKTGSHWFGVGTMIIESLDTAFLMDRTDIFTDAKKFVQKLSFSNAEDSPSSLFEVTIRILGGLLAAYRLSPNDSIFLEKSIVLGDILMKAFEAHPESSIPTDAVNLKKNSEANWKGYICIAEVLSIQLEFKTLTKLTGNSKYWNAAQKATKNIFEKRKKSGLVLPFVNGDGTLRGGSFHIGGEVDSYYEYLLKQWMLTNYTEPIFELEWRNAVKDIRENLLGLSAPSHFLFIGEKAGNRLSSKMEHLACFLPGSLALSATKGRQIINRNDMDPRDLQDLQLAEELAEACFQMYNQSPSGISADSVRWNEFDEQEHRTLSDMEKTAMQKLVYHQKVISSPSEVEFFPISTFNSTSRDFQELKYDSLLRPEVIESLYMLFRATGNEKYQHQVYSIFSNLKESARTSNGYANIADVRGQRMNLERQDRMESFFVAETLKYIYLTFADSKKTVKKGVDISNAVFNTEAHLLDIFTINDRSLESELLFLDLPK